MKRAACRWPAMLVVVAAAAAAGASGAAAHVATVQELRYPPATAFTPPQPQRVVLDNGLVVMLLEDHELPLITVTALLPVGGRLDPAGKLGLASLTGDLLRSSGVNRVPGARGGDPAERQGLSGDDLDDRLEANAATVDIDVGEDSLSATLSTPSAAFAELLPVFNAMLREPAFGDDKLDLAKNFTKAHLVRQNDDVDDLAAREIARLVYGGDSVYGRTPTIATIEAVTLQDIVAWHRANIHPDHMVRGIVGDFQSAAALKAVRSLFGSWPRGAPGGAGAASGAGGGGAPAGHLADFAYRTQANPGLFVIDKEDVSQSSVLMGHLGVVRSDPDYFAIQVLDEVIAGSFASRLVAHIRTEKGLAYDVGGGVGAEWDHPGLTLLNLSTQARTTAAGITALLAEARDLTAVPPTDDEVARARQGMLASFIFRSDSPAKVLDQRLLLELYGYPADWQERERAAVATVTTDEVRQAAARHIHPDQFTILVIGPDETHDPALATFGKVTALPMPDPLGQPRR